MTLVARREDRLTALATELADAHGVRAEVIGADLGAESGRDELFARVAALGLDVEILVNNAGLRRLRQRPSQRSRAAGADGPR